MICNGYEGHLLFVQVVVEHFKRLVALFGQVSCINEHHAVDGKLELSVATLAVDRPGKHRLNLIGRRATGTLVVVRIE